MERAAVSKSLLLLESRADGSPRQMRKQSRDSAIFVL